MKKKIKDLTFGELKTMCDKYTTCYDCPLYNLEYDDICKLRPDMYDEDILNQEVEVEEDE